ncbi:MAG: small multi-drug export protein [Patescibacteria group bacterium]
MLHAIAGFFIGVPPELAVVIVSMMPVLEQRVGIPLAILVYHMPVWKAYFLVMAGNIGPVLALLYFAGDFHAWVHKRSGFFSSRIWLKKLDEAQEAFKKYEKYGLLGLMIFVALPIPGSGIFTGAIIAFLMGVQFRHSWPYLVGAVLLSGLLTVAVTLGFDRVFF